MSVLLEALKKAAEDKKKQAADVTVAQVSTPLPSDTDVQEAQNMVSLELPTQTLEPIETPFTQRNEASSVDLKFNFEIPSLNESMPEADMGKAPFSSSEVVEPEVELPLESTREKPMASTTIAQQEEKQDESSLEPTVETAAVSENEQENISNQSSQLKADKVVPFQLKATEPARNAHVEDLEARLAENEMNAGESSVSSDVSVKHSSPEPKVVQSQDFLPEDDEAMFERLEASSTVDSVTQNNDEVELQITEDNETAEASSNISQREDDWSLDQIPGYQDYGLTKSQQEKTRKLLPHFSKPTQSMNKWRLYVITGILVVFGFGYYGLIYFGEQSTVIDQDLKRYQLMAQPVPQRSMMPHLPKTQSVDTTTQSKLKGSKTEQIVEKTGGSDGEKVSTALIQADEPNEAEVKTVVAKQTNSPKTVQKQVAKKEATRRISEKPKNLHIASKQQVSKELQAYTAYQAGDWQQAKQYYQQAYNESSESVSALFGLGAVSVQLGEKQKALNYYRRILKLEPNNALAQKAILGIQSSDNANEKIRDDLNRLSEANPNDAEVAFSLGNLYAKRGDWVSAQSYYFKAYQNDDSQANYALNLAVSLDQLGQYALAKRYYQDALAKVRGEQPSFDVAAIKKRLLALNQFLEKGK